MYADTPPLAHLEYEQKIDANPSGIISSECLTLKKTKGICRMDATRQITFNYLILIIFINYTSRKLEGWGKMKENKKK